MHVNLTYVDKLRTSTIQHNTFIVSNTLHVSAVLTGHHQALCTSYKTHTMYTKPDDDR